MKNSGSAKIILRSGVWIVLCIKYVTNSVIANDENP